jgi:hypothetical protein
MRVRQSRAGPRAIGVITHLGKPGYTHVLNRGALNMEKLLLLFGLLLAASSTSGSGLASLVLEGRELHASLRTPRLDSSWDLPPGVVPPKNPQLSSDDKFVQA